MHLSKSARDSRRANSHGADRDRTDDLKLAKLALSQLSYSPACCHRPHAVALWRDRVGLGGLEPPTLRLSGVRSNHLSYRPSSRTAALTSNRQTPESQRANAAPSKPDSKPSFVQDFDLVDTGRFRAWPLAPSRSSQQRPCLRRKEVIQPQVPLRLPCYDFTPVTSHSLGGSLLAVGLPTSGAPDSHGVTGGVYKARERIHRSVLICDY